MTRRGYVPTYAELPEVVNGYEQDRYEIKFVRPMTATNKIVNPSFETNTTSWAAFGASSIARVSTQQRRGLWGLQVTPTAADADGVFYTPLAIVLDSHYFLSFDFLGENNGTYSIQIGSAAAYTFRGSGKWERIVYPFRGYTNANLSLIIAKRGTSTTPFYLDGVQFEDNRCTTYLDGSMSGFVHNQVAYYWNGAEHASTSVRVANTRSGGVEVDLADYGFKVMAILGLGGDNFSNLASENAYLGGAIYERSIQTPGKFDIVGSFSGSLPDILRNKSDLRSLLRYDAGVVHQPLLMKIRVKNEFGDRISETMEVRCLYSGGLPGVRDNYHQERAALSFEIYDANTGHLDGTVGAAISRTLTVTGAYALRRVNGEWFPFGTGMNGEVIVLRHDPVRGRIYFGGDFTTGNGVTLNRIGYWDLALGTFVAMDGGVNSSVKAIRIDASGNVWVGGAFTTVGSGAAATKGLARWNISGGTWTAFNESTTGGAEINAIEVTPTGRVWIGGFFADWEGDLTSDNIAYTDDGGVNWNSAGTGCNDRVQAILYALDGKVYVGGQFTTANGVTVNRMTYWNGTTFVNMGAAISAGGVASIAQNPSGTIYIGGDFTNVAGIANADYVAMWTGTAWAALGSGLNNGVFCVHFGKDGILYASGQFILSGSYTFPRVAFWTGSTWLPINVTLPGSPSVRTIESFGLTILLGFDTTGSATGAVSTSVTNPGSTDTYPVFEFTGPGTLVQLTNLTSNESLFFLLTLLTGEKATLSLERGRIRFTSSFRGNILDTVIRGSTLAAFRLVAGVNTLSFLMTGGTVDTTSGVFFCPQYASLDDILYRV